jgi:tRNA threonylcarbamoyl adenosine modification protein (Sua5/YciO/YrdC/YwlC family)
MIIELFDNNPDQRKVSEIVEILQKGGIVVFPTDTVYSFGCSLKNKKGLEKLARLKGEKLSKANFSLICYDLSNIADYTKPMERRVYKAINKALPGPYTFILNASNEVPKLFGNKKKEIGIRIPNNNITRQIVLKLGNPLAVTSVHDEDEIVDYTTDPAAIFEKHENDVDIVIDAGYGNNVPSTVLDCTSGDIVVVREGIGDIDFI